MADVTPERVQAILTAAYEGDLYDEDHVALARAYLAERAARVEVGRECNEARSELTRVAEAVEMAAYRSPHVLDRIAYLRSFMDAAKRSHHDGAFRHEIGQGGCVHCGTLIAAPPAAAEIWQDMDCPGRIRGYVRFLLDGPLADAQQQIAARASEAAGYQQAIREMAEAHGVERDLRQKAKQARDEDIGRMQDTVRDAAIDAVRVYLPDFDGKRIDGGGSDGDEFDFTATEVAQAINAVGEALDEALSTLADLRSHAPALRRLVGHMVPPVSTAAAAAADACLRRVLGVDDAG